MARAHVDACPECQELLACMVQRTEGEAPRKVANVSSSSNLGGRSIGRYRLKSELGAGAMGVVYLAEDPQLHRTVALKIHRRQDAADADRLLREARSLARLSHPNVIVVHEVDTFEGNVFMAMEFVDGGSLRSWLEEKERATEEILDVFTQAARGLAVAHAAGIVHRDFKPDNVLVGRDGRVRVVDFGLAREVLFESLEVSRAATDPFAITQENPATLTRTGTLVGTPAYMAPEQWAGRRADARSDQFAFAVALFEALYGQRPFVGDTFAVLSRAVGSGEIVVPRHTRRIPKPMARALLRALRTDPKERFPSMDALSRALTEKERPAKRLAIGVGIALLCGIGGVARWKTTHAPVPAVILPEKSAEIAPPSAPEATPLPTATAALPVVVSPPPKIDDVVVKPDDEVKPATSTRSVHPPRPNGKAKATRAPSPASSDASPKSVAPKTAPEDLFDSIH